MQLGIGPDGPIRGRRVAVTGLGAVTCCGVGVDALWDGLLNPSVTGGAARNFEAEQWFGAKEVRQLDRFAQFSIAAADMAAEHAGDISADPAKAGVVFATGVGGFDTLAEQVGVYNEKGARRVSPRLVPMMMANAGAAGISMRLGWHGPSEVIVTACAAGSHAIGAAARLVATGRCDVAIGGGSEASMHPVAVAAFANMTALSTSGHSRPFDARRDGFVMTREAQPPLVTGGLGPRRRPWSDHLCRIGRGRQHRRCPPHHGPFAGRCRCRGLHGIGPGRCRHWRG